MYNVLRILFFLYLIPGQLFSQVLPKENEVLNYRLIGFSFPADQKASKYKLEIAAGNYNAEDAFKKHIISTMDSKDDKMIGEVPFFGCQYTWRSVYTNTNSIITSGPLHHFSTGILPEVDTNISHLRITKPAEKYKDDLVFLDASKALYDMNGRPVWYLPDMQGVKTDRTILCDLKITPQGTITFMNDEGQALEVNYKGTVLWRGPNNSHINKYTTYHHEFTRLSNGHYMILGYEPVFLKPLAPATIDSDLIIDDSDKIRTLGPGYRKDAFGTIIEYDENGKIAWSWKTSTYLSGSDLHYLIPVHEKHRYDVHENSFYFDEKNNEIYVSLRNISRIVKLKYPSGEVIAEYGEKYKPGAPEEGNDLFCGQHSIRCSKDGYLYLFDNNICNHDGHLPKIIMMRQPESKKGHLKKIWQYECAIEDDKLKDQADFGMTRGGNVIEMPDNEFFVSMSSQYSKLFIVDRDKNILWSALPEKWNKDSKHWDLIPQYRASIINRAELEKLIWSNEATR